MKNNPPNKQAVLFIDCQVLQTSSVNRGMGRYSAELLKATLNNGILETYKQLVLILNTDLGMSESTQFIHDINKMYDGVAVEHISNKLRTATEESLTKTTQLLDSLIQKKYPDSTVTFLILSNFETLESVSAFPTKGVKALLVYDLIPLLFSNEYLGDQKTEIEYLTRFQNIFEADVIFSISENTRNDLITYLNVSPHKIVSIAGGPIKQTQAVTAYKLPNKKEYFLFPSGDNWRKNNENTIAAFQKFNQQGKYQLVITSHFPKEVVEKLSKNDSNIVFTGHISDAQLNWLYKNARAVVFPSISEGLGLPLLEAIQYEKPIIASTLPVFQEFTNTGFVWCDPYNTHSITTAFEDVINDRLQGGNKYDAKEILKRFNWDNTAQKVVSELKKEKAKVIKKRKRVALVGPSYDSYSSIGKENQLLMATLNEVAEVDYYFEKPANVPVLRKSFANFVWEYRPIAKLPENIKTYDQVIYCLGNSEFHLGTYLLATHFPDTLILHDLDLSGLFQCLLDKLPTWQERYQLEESLNTEEADTKVAQFAKSLCRRQKKIIVHSSFAKKVVETLVNPPETEVIYQGLPVPKPSKIVKNNKKPRIAWAGIISEAKGLDFFIEIVDKFHKEYEFVVFGFTNHDPAYLKLAELEKSRKIQLQTNVSDYEFNNTMSKVNLLINLRPNYRGEASRTVLDGLRNGVIPIVNDIGWFAELPDNVAFKISNNQELIDLLGNQGLLLREEKEKKKNIFQYLRNEYDFEQYVKKLLVSI